jgi:hypothetical protein
VYNFSFFWLRTFKTFVTVPIANCRHIQDNSKRIYERIAKVCVRCKETTTGLCKPLTGLTKLLPFLCPKEQRLREFSRTWKESPIEQLSSKRAVTSVKMYSELQASQK